MYLRSSHIRLANHCLASSKWIEGSRSQKKIERNDQAKKYKNQNTKRTPFSFEYVGEAYNKPHQIIICMGEASKEEARDYLEKIIRKDEYPIVVSGVASVQSLTPWEQVAKEWGLRTEVLYINSKGNLRISASQLKDKIDGIIIGKEAQAEISQFKHSKDFRQLITFNYKHGDPIYKERLLPKEN